MPSAGTRQRTIPADADAAEADATEKWPAPDVHPTPRGTPRMLTLVLLRDRDPAAALPTIPEEA